MSNAVYTVYDIETTGLSAACQCEIIEFAGIKLDENFHEVDRLHVYVKPYRKLPKKIVELTGITDEQLASSENRYVTLPKIRSFIGNTISVCHNAQFDFSFISTMCLQQNLPVLRDYICTMKSYKAITGEKTAKLAIACANFGIELKNAHTAIADVEATVQLFKKLCEIDAENQKSKIHLQKTEDKQLTISLLSAMCAQNPNKKAKELLCTTQKSGRYDIIDIDIIIKEFGRGKTPVAICEKENYRPKDVAALFGLWLNTKRLPKFIYMEDTQINKQLKVMIQHSSSMLELLKIHDQIYKQAPANIGAYCYFWIKNRSVLDEEYMYSALDVLFQARYPIQKIIKEFPHILPCYISMAFCEFAEKHKIDYREYIRSSLCTKQLLNEAMEKCGGHFTNDEIMESPHLIHTAVSCALHERNFFKMT